jgi:lipopolysaccharide export system ATP-binding protein
VVGLLGPNGAGKTTTFYMTVGLTAPDSRPWNSTTMTSLTTRCKSARKGDRLLADFDLPRLTVEQNIMAILETMDLDGPARRARLGNCWPS